MGKSKQEPAKLGLVLSGGGAKGAYEIGVWKALKEYGLDKIVMAISGASIGALNACLYAQNDFEYAVKTWEDIAATKKLLTDELTDEILSSLAIGYLGNLTGYKLIPVALLLQRHLEGFGVLSNKGLKGMIKNHTDFKNTIPMYVSVFETNAASISNLASLNEPVPSYFKLNEETPEVAQKYVLASAAFPLLWKPVKIGNKRFLDGGIADNTPFLPLINKEKCTHIINVFLSHDSDLPLLSNSLKTIKECREKYPEVSFWNIFPSKTFKKAMPTFNFAKETVQELIQHGYEDACKVLKGFNEFMESEKQVLEQVGDYKEAVEKGNEKIKENRKFRESSEENSQEALDKLAKEIDAQELKLLNSGIDDFLERFEGNSAELLKFAFEGISVLNSTDGRIKSLGEKGFWGEFFGALSGSTSAANEQIQLDQNKAIYCNQQLIKKLSERSALTMEAVVAIQNRLNYQMSHINFIHVHNQRQTKYIEALKNYLELFSRKTIAAIRRNEVRIGALEKKFGLYLWGQRIRVALDEDEKDTGFKILKLVSGMYTQTNGVIDDDSRCFFLNLIKDTNLHDEQLSINNLIKVVKEQPQALDDLKTDRFFPVSEDAAKLFPLMALIQHSHETGNEESLIRRFPILGRMDLDLPVDADKLALELLLSLENVDKELLPMDKNPLLIKNRYRGIIDSVKKEIEPLESLAEMIGHLNRLDVEVEKFKAIVPIVGKFSAGKSRLINCWLGQDVQEEDVNPTTALATEILYGETERAELYDFKGGTVETKIEKLRNRDAGLENISHARIYLKNLRLKNRQNLVLVDMPGFDSPKNYHEKAIASYIQRGHEYILLLRRQANSVYDLTVINRLKEINLKFKKPFSILVSEKGLPADSARQQQVEPDILKYYVWAKPIPKLNAIDLSAKHDVAEFEKKLDEIAHGFPKVFVEIFENKTEDLLGNLVKKIRSIAKLSSADIEEIESKLESLQSEFEAFKSSTKNTVEDTENNLNNKSVARVRESVERTLIANLEVLVEKAFAKSGFNERIMELVRIASQREFSVEIKSELEKLQEKLKKISFPGDFNPVIEISNITVPELSQGWAAGAIVAVIGGFLGGPIGIFIGALLGKFFGSDDEKKAKEEVRNKIVGQIIPKICDGVEIELKKHVSNIINSIEENLDKEIELSKNEYERNLSQARSEKQAKIFSHEEKTRELESKAVKIEEKIKQLSLS